MFSLRKFVPYIGVTLMMTSVSFATDIVAQKMFASPQEAVQTVVQACRHNNIRLLLECFGPEGKDIVESGDRKEDKMGRRTFVKLAQEKLDFAADPANPDKITISLGTQQWPFPVPLMRKDGRWFFDSSQGREEIVARRVGANELNAVEVCRGYVEAQLEYAQNHFYSGIPEYAQKLVSSPEKQDGLYWPAVKGKPSPDIPEGLAKAAASMDISKRQPYHGYFFAILTAQGKDAPGGAMSYLMKNHLIGGFALVAWPAEYGVSGVQTFIVNHSGTVYEKHLGPETNDIVKAMTEFNPDSSWQPVPETPSP